jgi:hypothetical protein
MLPFQLSGCKKFTNLVVLISISCRLWKVCHFYRLAASDQIEFDVMDAGACASACGGNTMRSRFLNLVVGRMFMVVGVAWLTVLPGGLVKCASASSVIAGYGSGPVGLYSWTQVGYFDPSPAYTSSGIDYAQNSGTDTASVSQPIGNAMAGQSILPTSTNNPGKDYAAGTPRGMGARFRR